MLFLVASLLVALSLGALPTDVSVVQIKGLNGTIPMPLAGLGTWLYPDKVAHDAVKLAFSLGYRHVDTAFVYENQVGVGQALKESGLARDSYFVTTKIPGGLNSSATAATLDTCMQQLNLDYVDLMLIHFPASFDGKGGRAGRQEEWKALEAWAKSGKARAIGVSHYCQRHLEDVLEIATVPIAVNQVQYHVGMGAAGNLATDDRDFVISKGILYESFSPFCGPCDPPYNMELITGPLVTGIGKAHNKTGAQVALRWLVQQGIPVIPRSNSTLHLKQNYDIFDFELTAEEMSRLTASTTPPVGGGPGPTDSGDCTIDESPSLIIA